MIRRAWSIFGAEVLTAAISARHTERQRDTYVQRRDAERTQPAPLLDVTPLDTHTLAALTGRCERTARSAIAAAARDNPDAVVTVRTGRPGRPKRVLLLPDVTL